MCSTLTSAFAILFVTSVPSVEPTTAGNFYELYAIAAAVMGGCSLRGGEGNVLGILLGTCIIWLLYNYVLYRGFPETLRDASIGLALLLAAFIDEMLRRYYGGYRKALHGNQSRPTNSASARSDSCLSVAPIFARWIVSRKRSILAS